VTARLEGVPETPRLLNEATPLLATAVSVVLPVPTTVPELKVAVTVLVAVATLLFPASRTSTTGWVVKAEL
jgi:hypothetical protein